MEDTIVSFKTAKLAKEKGFDLEVKDFYYESSQLEEVSNRFTLNMNDPIEASMELSFNYREKKEQWNVFSAPTQSLLQKWLREKYNILVEIKFDTISFGYRIFNPLKSTDYFTEWKYEIWDFEEALDRGLYQALLLLPDKK